MAESLFSPSWYRVARLKPRLRGHARIHRHEYRGETWYVLQDHAKGRFYRFTPVVQHLIGLMDGERTVQELWECATGRFGDDGPTQGEVVQLLSQLHAADVLLCDVPPDTAELLRRAQKVRRARWSLNLRTPLALRLPLLDPERILSRTVGLVRPLFSPFGALIWLAVVGTAAVLAGIHWSELTENVMDRVLSAENLLLIWLAFPLVKALHEFGHGYAVKVWGGEVHEMGIILLVLVPVPYVDASAASEFRARYQRVLVGAAGIAVDLFVASVALFLWLALEPGSLRSVAYNLVLIGSVSTILFNANPLLRYDGYYVLSDLIEILNLAPRGLNYLGYLLKRHALGIKEATPPHVGPGERPWFIAYSVAAFCYRAFIYAAIALFIAGKFFTIGILLAAWAVLSMIVLPVLKALKFGVSSPLLRERRPRALALCGAALLGLLLALFVLPFPSWTGTQGVVWVPEDALVRTGTDGFVSRVAAPPNSRVARGDLLMECRDPFLLANVRVLRARLEEMVSRYDAAVATDPVQAQVVREEIRDARASLARAEERLRELEIRSPGPGLFVLPDAEDLPGLYVRQGDLVAYVLDVDRPTIRVVVPQLAVDLVRQRTRSVEVRLAERLARALPAIVRREVPEAAERLPSTVLGRAGGGAIAIDPTDRGGTKTFEKLFQFDLELTEPMGNLFIGGRAYVRFDHGLEPAGIQLYRRLRQILLRRLNV